MTLRSFYLDPATGDLVFDGQGRLRMTDDREAQMQRLRLRLGTRLGEWFLDTSLGVPWLDLVEKGVPPNVIRQAVLSALQADEEVTRVDELTIHPLDGGARTLRIDFTVTLRDESQLANTVEVAV